MYVGWKIGILISTNADATGNNDTGNELGRCAHNHPLGQCPFCKHPSMPTLPNGSRGSSRGN